MPPVKPLAKAIGSKRAAFYRQILKRAKKFVKVEAVNGMFDEIEKYDELWKDLPLGSKERKKAVDDFYRKAYKSPSVKELTDMEGIKAIKESLRSIDPVVFDDLDAVVPPISPYNIWTSGFYTPHNNRIKLNYELNAQSPKGGKTVPHELWHHMQNRLGELPASKDDIATPFIEMEADAFAEAVHKRAKGGPREDIPKKFLPYILGLIGAMSQKKEE